MRIPVHFPLVAASLLLAVLSPACRTSEYAFLRDRRVTILTPKQGESVRLPLVLRWTTKPGAPTPKYALFVDRTPMPPGSDLRSLVAGDPACMRIPKCPDEITLNQRGVYTTSATTLTIEGLVDTRPVNRPSAIDRHAITIVLLNAEDRRLDEAAYTVEFDVERAPQSAPAP